MIDLDLAPPPSEPAARLPLLARLRAELALPRPLAVAAVAVVTLLTLGGAIPPAPVLTEVMAVGGTAASAFVLGRSALYTSMFGLTPNSQAGVRRFALADGSVQWAVEVRHDVQNMEVNDSAHVLMARSGGSPEITFLDTDSGKTLWRSTSADTSVLRMAESTVLLHVFSAEGDPERFQVADVRTGRPVWSRDVGPLAALDFGPAGAGPATRIITVTADGRATVLGFTDGAVRATADLARPISELGAEGTDDGAEVTVLGDRLYLMARTGGEITLVAYDADTLTPLWRTAGVPRGVVGDCGPVVCLQGAGATTGVDAANGAVRWTRTGIESAVPLGGSGTRRLIAYGPVRQDEPDAVLLDPVTGRQVAPLGRSLSVGDLVLRADQKEPGRTWVASPDGRGSFRTVGSLLTAAPYGCSARGAYLACPTSAGPTAVWRVPS